MGYNTDFEGSIRIEPCVKEETLAVVEKLNDMDYRDPDFPKDAPRSYLQWMLEENELCWDGSEKFYLAAEWVEWLMKNVFIPGGYICNGEICAQGEEMEDRWKIEVKDNVVNILQGRVVYE